MAGVAGSLAVSGGAAWPAASSAAAHRRGPLPAPPLPPGTRHRPGHPPLRTQGDRACTSGRAVLLAPGILSPRKDPAPIGRTVQSRLGMTDPSKTGHIPGTLCRHLARDTENC
jgi:hypothetical protein